MHTGSKLHASPRERLLELEHHFPFVDYVARPLFVVTAAATLFVFALGFVAWNAGVAIYDLWSGYTEWINETAAPPRPW
jgi:hypothetical protein